MKNLPNCASLLVPAAKSLPDIGRAKGNVAVFALDAIDSTPVDIYTRISAVYRSAAPHWSQVLWCGPSTTQAQLTTFYERCERNTDVVFVMVAPNTLPRELWDLVQEGMLGLIHGSGPMTASEPTTAAGT